MPNALLFDMDQTLVHSADVWREAVIDLFGFLKRDLSYEIAAHFSGLNMFDLTAKAIELTGATVPLAEAQHYGREALVRSYRKGSVSAMPGAVELVKRLHGIAPMVVASGSPLEGIEIATEHLGIKSCFTRLLSSESVARGKPHPDVFLKAAELVGATPKHCVVFEDTVVGVLAAIAAGMPSLVVPSCDPALLKPLATRMYGHWDEVSAGDVRAFLVS